MPTQRFEPLQLKNEELINMSEAKMNTQNKVGLGLFLGALFGVFCLGGWLSATSAPTSTTAAAEPAKQEEHSKLLMLTAKQSVPACSRAWDLAALSAQKSTRGYYNYIAEHDGCMEIPAGTTMVAQCLSHICVVQEKRGQQYLINSPVQTPEAYEVSQDTQ